MTDINELPEETTPSAAHLVCVSTSAGVAKYMTFQDLADYFASIAAGGGESYDADAQAYFDVLTSPSTPYMDATNDLIVELKAQGIWTKLQALYLLRHGTTITEKK
jgi:hypothetical protein